MDQILLQRSRDEHTSARLSAERIPSISPLPVLKPATLCCSFPLLLFAYSLLIF